MRKNSSQNRFVVRKSGPGLGRGLFAVAPIRKGDFIVEYTGRRIPTSHADTLKTRYLFEVDEEWAVDGSSQENVARYMNHSCVPNCECDLQDKKVLILAIRDIRIGEELTFDYGDEYFDEFIRPTGCKCARCAAAADAALPV